jgi:chromosome segregation ATPase
MKGVLFMGENKLEDAIKLLREYCGNIPLSNAIINIVEHDKAVEELINKLRKENENCKAQYQHWDKRYSEALIKMREMKEEIERLKTENEWYKKLMDF